MIDGALEGGNHFPLRSAGVRTWKEYANLARDRMKGWRQLP